MNSKRLMALAFGFWVLTGPLYAQLVSYNVNYIDSLGNPGGVNTIPDFNSLGWMPVLGPGLSFNQWSNNQAIPFNFLFYNQTVSQFAVTANGVLAFDPMSPPIPGINTNIPTSSLPDNSVACFWTHFTTTPPTGTNDFVYSRVFGIPPFRQFWIKWSSFEWGGADFAYLAIVLEESTNKIYVVDMYSSTNSSTVSTTVGLQKDNSEGVMAGNNLPLGVLGPGNSDNRYYEFTPFIIQPLDLKPVSVLSPEGAGCGLNQEAISFSYTNIGQNLIAGITATFSVDGGPFINPETITSTILPGDTLNYVFSSMVNLSGVGNHQIQIAITTPGDGDTSNDTISFSVYNVLNISTFPYKENFENGAGGWSSQGINNSWELATPDNDTINTAFSGTQAWITNANGNYNDNEQSAVLSPCFDLSGANQDYWVTMKIWWESEFSWDGAVLQSSSDLGETWSNVGAFGDPNFWFNDTTINGLPGNQLEGWTGNVGTANGSGGWVAAKHPIDPSLFGQSQIRFRVAFGSDAVNTEDGFAFDDFGISQAPQIDLGSNGFFCEGDFLDAGNPGQTYLWSTGDTTQTILLSNTTGAAILDSLIHVSVTDSFGLTSMDSIKVSLSASSMNLSQSLTQNVFCFGDSTGGIFTTVSGGVAPYQYLWNNGDTVQNIFGLPAGDYTLLATDHNGCSDTLGPITLTQNPEIIVMATQTDVSCFGDSTGDIQLTSMGGIGGFNYIWSTSDTTNQITSLGVGNYMVTVSDSLNCFKQLNFSITEPDSISIDLTELIDVSCFGDSNGSIDISPSGGTPPYQYLWNNGNMNEDISNLSQGFYFAEIQDSNGCLALTDTFEVSFQDSIPIAGFSYDGNSFVVNFTDSSKGATSYFWNFGDGSPDSTSTLANPSHFYNDYGIYLVTLIVSNDCGSDTITKNILVSVSIEKWETDSTINIYPNPNQGNFFIDFSLPTSRESEILIYDLSGKLIYEEKLFISSNSYTHSISLPSSISRGVYLMDIISGKEKISTQRILVE